MSKNLIFFSLAMSLAFASCAKPKVTEPVLTKLTSEIPTQAYQSTNPNLETIAVVALNDFHGSLMPREKKLPDGRIVQSGGAEALAGMIKILKEEMPGRVAIIDAGDEWQGTLESNLSKGANVVDFYNRLGVNVAAIGNHEFDFGLVNMTNQFEKANYSYVAANVTDKTSKMLPDWKNVKPSTMIKVGGVKIGVIGFSTRQTPNTTRYINVAKLDFNDPLAPTKKEAKQLRKNGAKIVLVTAHAGTVCEENLGLRDWKLWEENTPNSQCDEDQEIFKLAAALKPKEVDGIIAGHTHHIIHHFFNHIPTVQGEAFNQYFNVIYYTFEKKSHKLIPELTRIEGLIPICFDVFKGTHSCDSRKLSKDESPELVQATFHGRPVPHDPKIDAWLKPIEESTDQYRRQVLTKSVLPLSHYRDQESPMGNLMADVLIAKSHADFSLVNSGGIRASLDAGDLTYDGLYRAIPFDNVLNVVTMTGAQVKLMFRLAVSGTHGFPSFSGAKLTVIPLNEKAPKTDLNGDHKTENWETNRLLKAERDDGGPIDDNKLYTVATYDFLVTGGDDLKFVMDQIPKERISQLLASNCRDLAVEYFQTHRLINTVEHPLVDPKNPRIILLPNSGI